MKRRKVRSSHLYAHWIECKLKSTPNGKTTTAATKTLKNVDGTSNSTNSNNNNLKYGGRGHKVWRIHTVKHTVRNKAATELRLANKNRATEEIQSVIKAEMNSQEGIHNPHAQRGHDTGS